MISVLQNLLHDPGNMKRVYFYWTVRDRTSFEMFSGLMEDIYEKDKDEQVEIRHFLTTGSHDDRDLGSVLLAHARSSIHASCNLDILLGHKSRCQVQLGRPKWPSEMALIAETAKSIGENRVGVFLCASQSMADDVRAACAQQSSDNDFRMLFHKETF